MRFRAFAAGLSIVAGLATAAVGQQQPSAATEQDKMETCKFGAAEQKLTGAKEREFIRKCMAKDDAPASKKK
jgi:hypothetical protein